MKFKFAPVALAIMALPALANNASEEVVNAKFAEQSEEQATIFGTNEQITYQRKDLDGKTLAVYEGDIILGEHQEVQSKGADPLTVKPYSDNQFEASWGGRTTWPNGVVPYVINSSVPAQDVTTIKAAMKWIEDAANITFVERGTQTSYINIIRGDGCYSMVGRIGRKQDLSIGRGCGTKGIVAHEFLHALGFYHEQSRADRDNHVNILWQNIRPGMESNFNKGAAVTASIGPYDVKSIMHYGYKAFSTNGQPTITSKDPNVPNTALGQRQYLTDLDIAALQEIYGKPTGGTVPTPTPPPPANSKLTNGASVSASGSKGGDVFYSIEVPTSSTLNVSISGGTGDADLYVKGGSKPSTNSYDCRPYKDGNSESCSIANAKGTYHIMLRGYANFSNVTLTASYAAGPTPTVAPTITPTVTPTVAPTQPPVTPPPAGNCGNAWSASTVYNSGDTVSFAGNQYKANWWTKGESPAQNSGQWQVWSLVASCS